jgi:hypothetical protein
MRRSIALIAVFFGLILVVSQTTESRSQVIRQDPEKTEPAKVPERREMTIVFRRPPPSDRFFRYTERLMKPGVLTELKVTPEQQKKIEPLQKEWKDRIGKLGEEFGPQQRKLLTAEGLLPEQREALRLEIHVIWNAQTIDADEQMDAACQKILTPKQWSRLRQISMQFDGPYALLRPDVITQLNINELQIENLREILDSSREAFTSTGKVVIPRTGEGLDGNKEYQKKLTVGLDSTKIVEQAMMRKIARVLTRKQLASFEQMLGEPFNLTGHLVGSPYALRAKEEKDKASSPNPTRTDPPVDTPKADPKKSLRERRGGTPTGQD